MGANAVSASIVKHCISPSATEAPAVSDVLLASRQQLLICSGGDDQALCCNLVNITIDNENVSAINLRSINTYLRYLV